MNRPSNRITLALSWICCAAAASCGEANPTGSESESASASSSSGGTDTSAGTATTVTTGTSDTDPTTGDDTTTTVAPTTTGNDTTTTGNDTTTTGVDTTTTGVDTNTTGNDTTTTGGVEDPWNCEGGEPITVNEQGKYLTLAAAVAAAPPDATITVCPGTYEEAVIIDRPMTLIGAGADKTFLDGGGVSTQIFIDAVNVTIEGFTFQNGEAEHDPLGNSLCGGAIAIDHAFGAMTVTIKDCVFTANHGSLGGAICYDGSGNDDSLQTLVLDGVTITGNSADSNGGGLFSYSSTTMIDTTITDNTAGNKGGGIYFSYSDNKISGGAVKRNSAAEGGGMFLQSPVTVDVSASDWGFGQTEENLPNDVQHHVAEYGFFGSDVSFFCEFIEWNSGMCALK